MICDGNSGSQYYISILDRKSTRLNSSHLVISYAVFCLKKKKISFIHAHIIFALMVACTADRLPVRVTSTLIARVMMRASTYTALHLTRPLDAGSIVRS